LAKLYGGYYSGRVKPVEDVLAMLVPLDWTVEDSKKAAQIHATLTKTGKNLNVKDVLIAGPCIARSIPLITLSALSLIEGHFPRFGFQYPVSR
jgi:predicted nucleic acid-binding protein